MDHVTSGVLTVGRQVPDARGGGRTLSNSVDVEVGRRAKPHASRDRRIRPASRRSVALAEGTVITDLARSQLWLRTLPPVSQMPTGFINFTDQQWSAWWDRFYASPEGPDYLGGFPAIRRRRPPGWRQKRGRKELNRTASCYGSSTKILPSFRT